jgi:hypothetical protein
MGVASFPKQSFPLRDTKPMLLIDHDKPQIVDPETVLDQGMGADNNPWCPLGPCPLVQLS